MRQHHNGAIRSDTYVRPVRYRAHYSAFALGLAFLAGYGNTGAALTDSRLAARSQRVVMLQPGPRHSYSAIAPDSSYARADSAFVAPVPAAPARLFSESYWSAFADLDLPMLRESARGDVETTFAEAMHLLANGDAESADNLFLAVAQQQADVNAAVAAQVMLASTLRYEHKWAQLRDLQLTSKLSDLDQRLTDDLERWGKAFENAERELTQFPIKPVTLPLRVTPVGTPTVRVRINGEEYDFWLDTGSSMTVISSEVARGSRVGVLSHDTLTVRTFSGSAPVHAAILKRMEIGPIVLTNSPAVIIDTKLMYLKSSAEGVPSRGLKVDGIIGWDVIRQFDLTMNYATGTITLKQPLPRGFGDAVPQNLAWLGKPMVDVQTKDGSKLHFMLDTGAQATFLNGTAVEKAGAGTKSSDQKVYGIARTGRQTQQVVPFLTLVAGGKSMRLRDVIVYGPASSGLINIDGILGSDIAQFGTVHINATSGVFSIDSALTEDGAE